jgi:hypothetical protein
MVDIERNVIHCPDFAATLAAKGRFREMENFHEIANFDKRHE